MGSEWPICSLKEAGVQLIDCDHKTPKAQESGFPYIGIPQMKEGNIDFDANPRLISESDLVTWTKKAKPQTNDVILSRRCNSGETVHVGSRTEFALGQNLVILRAVGERVFPPFLRWVVRSPQWWGEVGKYLNPGAIFESLKCKDIPKFEVPLPPLPEQKAIAHILGTLDDKIELNRRMNATLEGMAQALFKSWFVDFDPVMDNALAAGNPIPDTLAPRAEVRKDALAKVTIQQGSLDHPTLSDPKSLFPAAFQCTEELGWIPEGWQARPLAEEVQLTMGQSPSSDHYNTEGNGLPFHQGVTNYGTRFPKHEQFSTGGNRYAENGDVLFSVRAPVGRINLADRRLIIGRGLAALRHKKSYQSFLIYFLKQTFATEDSIGSGTIFNAVNKKEMERISLIVPPDITTKAFDEIANSLDEKIANNAEEAETLTKLRDTLLPKLITGDIEASLNTAHKTEIFPLSENLKS